MKVLRKTTNKKLCTDIEDLIHKRISFFYNTTEIKRFFVPDYCIYSSNSTNNSSDEVSSRIAFALIDCLDNTNLTLASYIASNGCFVVMVGKTFNCIISAVKHAKIEGENDVIDLLTGKLFESNG